MELLTDIIDACKNIVVLTGAGISTDSGIPDFRSNGGLWSDPTLLSSMSKAYFESRPKLFWPAYKSVFVNKMCDNIEPNMAHFFLANLEQQGKNIHIFTQNVDSLHQKAGSLKVYELHGNANTAFCPKHKILYKMAHFRDTLVPRCQHINGKGKVCNFILKPSVVLFGDTIKHFKDVEILLKSADLLLVMGTSLSVSPVNKIPTLRTKPGCIKVLINNESTELDHLFDYIYINSISKALS